MIRFDINPRLEGDSVYITDLELCAIRLMKDANYPWLLMVPRRSDLIEIIDLDQADRVLLMSEICAVSEALKTATDCEKLNVGALGNQVSQLHVHVIARFREDAAWPNPVWGAVAPTTYDSESLERRVSSLRDALSIS